MGKYLLMAIIKVDKKEKNSSYQYIIEVYILLQKLISIYKGHNTFYSLQIMIITVFIYICK